MTSPIEILKRSLALYRANFALFFGFASWLLLTQAAFVLLTFLPESNLTFGLMFGVQVADIILWMWVGVLMTLLAAELASGKTPDGQALASRSSSLILSFAWVGFLQGITTVGGFLLLVVPGFVFLVWFAYAQGALAIDGHRGTAALTASKELVRGRFFTAAWNLFCGPFLIGLVYLAVLLAVGLAAGLATEMGVFLSGAGGTSPPDMYWLNVLSSVIAVFLTPLLYAYSTISYLELKRTR